MKQLFETVEYLHALGNGIVHGDMKAENCLLTERSDARGVLLKVSDFGLFWRRKSSTHSKTGIIGTYGYMAPEVLRNQPWDMPADLWAVGILLYRLLKGFHPFERGQNVC